MKKALISFAIVIACLSAKCQLANHKWEGSIQIDNQATLITLDFKKDTVDALITASGELLEEMTYTVKNGIVTFQKVNGRSECGSDIIGKYKFSIKNDTITLTVAEDICGSRAEVLDQSTWKKVKK
ncbi:MAG: hypothetical protein JST09_10570 [Bacteroidetes bacterium]|nr:hypothetical protein [Bacteroidota bacterium]